MGSRRLVVKVLAVDTSSDIGSVAVVCDAELAAEQAFRGRARHGERLLGHIEHALEAAEVPLGEIDLLAVGLGPGSFTGLRVGLATIKGLALSCGHPVVGIPSLEVLARGLGPALAGAVAVPVVEAHRGEVFAAAYGSPPADPSPLIPPFHATPADAARHLRERLGDRSLVLCGSGARGHADELAEHLAPAVALAPPLWDAPRAAVLATLAEAEHARRGPCDLLRLEPLYVRPSDAKLPARPLRTE